VGGWESSFFFFFFLLPRSRVVLFTLLKKLFFDGGETEGFFMGLQLWGFFLASFRGGVSMRSLLDQPHGTTGV